MSRYLFQGTARDGMGRVLAAASVNVYLAGTTTVATIYAASSGGSAIPGGLVTSADDGSFSFWVDSADYAYTQFFKVLISKGGFSAKTYDNIIILPVVLPSVPFSIGNGGTGADTAGGALSNLGFSAFVQGLISASTALAFRAAIGSVIGTDVQAYDANTLKGNVVATTSKQIYPAAVPLADLSSFDCDANALATYTLAANGTLPAATNHGNGKSGELIITGASTYTLSANANWKMADGSTVALSPAAGKKTRIIWESDGTYMMILKVIQEA